MWARRADRSGGLGGGVDQILAQDAEDAVAGGQHLDRGGAAAVMTAEAVALMTAVTPPDWA